VDTRIDPPVGPLIDIVREAASAGGCSLAFVPVPRARAEHMMFDTASADILAPAVATAHYRPSVLFVRVGSDTLSVLSLRHANLGAHSLASIASQPWTRAVQVRGYAFGDEYAAFMKKLQEQGRVDTVRDWRSAFTMLAARRAQFMILPTASISGVIQATSMPAGLQVSSCVLTDARPIHFGYLVASRLQPDVRVALAKAVAREADRVAELQRQAAARAPVGHCTPGA
jgi:ABC-type amino acid transport substrate-binding protein